MLYHVFLPPPLRSLDTLATPTQIQSQLGRATTTAASSLAPLLQFIPLSPRSPLGPEGIAAGAHDASDAESLVRRCEALLGRPARGRRGQHVRSDADADVVSGVDAPRGRDVGDHGAGQDKGKGKGKGKERAVSPYSASSAAARSPRQTQPSCSHDAGDVDATRTVDITWSQSLVLPRSSRRPSSRVAKRRKLSESLALDDASIASEIRAGAAAGTGAEGGGTIDVDSSVVLAAPAGRDARRVAPGRSRASLRLQRSEGGGSGAGNGSSVLADLSRGEASVDEAGVTGIGAARPGAALSAANLAQRALGPRRSSRIRTSDASNLGTLLNIDMPDSLLSLNTTTTLTPPTQAGSHPDSESIPALALPKWTLPLARLTPLHALLAPSAAYGAGAPHRRIGLSRGAAAPAPDDRATGAGSSASRRCTVLVCVVSVDPTVQRQRKEEKARGGEGSLWIGEWKVLGPPVARAGTGVGVGAGLAESDAGAEVGCGVKLWNDVAREWDGRVRRGDVVLLENAEYRPATSKDPASLSLSLSAHTAPHLLPRITILYRTLPRALPGRGTRSDYVHGYGYGHQHQSEALPLHLHSAAWIAEDRALRPDLRLERSDMGVRKVKEVARWFAQWVGGVPPG